MGQCTNKVWWSLRCLHGPNKEENESLTQRYLSSVIHALFPSALTMHSLSAHTELDVMDTEVTQNLHPLECQSGNHLWLLP